MAEFPLVLECAVVGVHELGLHTQFIGEIKTSRSTTTASTRRGASTSPGWDRSPSPWRAAATSPSVSASGWPSRWAKRSPKRELYGYHQVKFLTPFENACWTILSQRNHRGVAQHLKGTMVREFSAAVELDGRLYWPFPGAKTVVRASVADLTRLPHNSRRAEYIHGAAVAFSEVDEDLCDLCRGGHRRLLHFVERAGHAELPDRGPGQL